MAKGSSRQFTAGPIDRMGAGGIERLPARVHKCISHLGTGLAFRTADPILDGEFHWVREIARGSFCSANLIRGEKSGRELVMKIAALDSDSSDHDDSLGKGSLETEIRALTRIQSPHVPKLYAHNLGQNQGTAGDRGGCELFCVIDFIEGETLLDVDSKLDPAGLFRVAVQVAKAMEAAHIASICHRDVVDDNIMVAFDGDGAPFSRLIDFGIAKILPQDPAYPDRFGPTAVPHPYERDPAAHRFEDMDCRSDIYMLGITLALNAGIYRGYGEIDPKRAMQESLFGRIPREAIDVIAKAVEKDPDRRFQTAREMRLELENALRLIDPRESI